MFGSNVCVCVCVCVLVVVSEKAKIMSTSTCASRMQSGEGEVLGVMMPGCCEDAAHTAP